MGCASNDSIHIIETLRVIYSLKIGGWTRKHNEMAMSISHTGATYTISRNLARYQVEEDLLKIECIRLRLYTTQWCVNGGQDRLHILIAQWRMLWEAAVLSRVNLKLPLSKEALLCLALTGEKRTPALPKWPIGSLYYRFLRMNSFLIVFSRRTTLQSWPWEGTAICFGIAWSCIHLRSQQQYARLEVGYRYMLPSRWPFNSCWGKELGRVETVCRTSDFPVGFTNAQKISYEITMDIFGRLLPSGLLDCSLAIQTAYMEMVCAGRCVSECTTQWVNHFLSYREFDLLNI